MAKIKISKRDEYIEQVQKFAAYVDTEEDVVGIYATVDNSIFANKNNALKKLTKLFNFKIQMVIK